MTKRTRTDAERPDTRPGTYNKWDFTPEQIAKLRAQIKLKSAIDIGGCMSWQGPFYPKGYGALWTPRGRVRAHR